MAKLKNTKLNDMLPESVDGISTGSNGNVSLGAVRYSATQSLTDAQKSKARENIDAASTADATLTERGFTAWTWDGLDTASAYAYGPVIVEQDGAGQWVPTENRELTSEFADRAELSHTWSSGSWGDIDVLEDRQLTATRASVDSAWTFDPATTSSGDTIYMLDMNSGSGGTFVPVVKCGYGEPKGNATSTSLVWHGADYAEEQGDPGLAEWGGTGELVGVRTALSGYQLGTQEDKPLASEAEAEALRTGKQDLLTFDNAPMAGSQNPVTSSGIRSAIDNAKHTMIYNVAGTDALDDKGGLHTGTIQQSIWTAKASGAADIVYDYVGYLQNQENVNVDGMTATTYVHVWNKHNQSVNVYDRIFYNPATGKIYSIYLNSSYARKYTILATQETNVDPRLETGLLASMDNVSVAGRTVNLKFTPTAVNISSTAYAHFALESLPDRAYSTSSAYAVGDLVKYNGEAYRCNTAIASGEAWNASHWTKIPLADGKVSKAGDTMTGGLTVPYLTVGSRGSGTIGTNSVVEGSANVASGNCSHAEGISFVIASGAGSHAEGIATTASGDTSHAEGSGTTAQNLSEHAQGQFNTSHKSSNTFGDSGNTLSSIGFGTSANDKKNAVETMQDGKTFIYGIGDYNGTNPTGTGVKDLATAINGKQDALSQQQLDNIDAVPSKLEQRSMAPEFDATKDYVANEHTTYNGVLYRFTADHAAGAWTGNDVVEDNATTPDAMLDITSAHKLRVVGADGTIIWQEADPPVVPVQSVNSKTGTVVLTGSDIEVSSTDDTTIDEALHDINESIPLLDSRLDALESQVPPCTADTLAAALGISVSGSTTMDALRTHFSLPDTATLQDVLTAAGFGEAAFAYKNHTHAISDITGLQDALKYAIVTPTVSTSGTVASATLQDHAINNITLGSSITQLNLTFPPEISGMSRDFYLRLTITGNTPPEISFTGSPTFDVDDDEWANIESGVNIILFTETNQ